AVIGPMRLTRDGVPVDAPELRRARVRQLLSALAVRPVLTRDQANELLWPGLAPAKAARNMRVTLTHLRRLLEPDRSGGDASYHLRTDGDTIRLLESEFLSVDLWTLDRLDKRAVQARAERALSLEPFDARGHRVALAAALRGRRPAQIAAARRRVGSALRQLGVPPDPPTEILLRQAARWASAGATRAQ